MNTWTVVILNIEPDGCWILQHEGDPETAMERAYREIHEASEDADERFDLAEARSKRLLLAIFPGDHESVDVTAF